MNGKALLILKKIKLENLEKAAIKNAARYLKNPLVSKHSDVRYNFWQRIALDYRNDINSLNLK